MDEQRDRQGDYYSVLFFNWALKLLSFPDNIIIWATEVMYLAVYLETIPGFELMPTWLP